MAVTQRVATTTLTLPQNPVSPSAPTYRTANAFPSLTFSQPVGFAIPPGETNRLFVIEKSGQIAVITNLAAPTRTIFLSLTNRLYTLSEGGVLGLAFHPHYASNRQFYVFYTRNDTTVHGTGIYDRVSRFITSPSDPNLALSASETILISQFDQAGNHNGGDLQFGPDGYLYVSVGDEGGANDFYQNSQRIDGDFFSGILRLDVDMRPGSLPPNAHPASFPHYAIPADNPFIGATQFNSLAVNPAQVRTEFYAVGLRNPWRMSFDPVTGTLYAGDVGQGAREEVDVIVKGGNYGWKWREGMIANPSMGTPPAGFTSWIDPILDYPRGSGTYQGNSITGGRIFRGMRAPELVGEYVFADYVSGNIWSLTYTGGTATAFTQLAKLTGISGFGTDPRSGDPWLAELANGRIHWLLRDPGAGGSIPQHVNDAGLFLDPRTLTPNPGVEPYALNWPSWNDGARDQRWFCVPDPARTIDFSPTGHWSFPTGSVWVQHFDLPTVVDGSAAVRRVESRVLVRTADGAGGYGLSYRWGGFNFQGFLVPTEGLSEALLVPAADGSVHTQVWRYPSRSECLSCHQPGAGFALGFSTPQLNRDIDNGLGLSNQIAALSQTGYFTAPVSNRHTLPRLAQPDDHNWSLEHQARSYVHVNCSQCHYPFGPAPANFDARISTPLANAGILGGALNDNGGDTNVVVVRPGSPPHSMLLTRIASRDSGRMPPLVSTVVDTQAVALITAWITGPLTNFIALVDWQWRHFGGATNPIAAPDADPDGDHAINDLEYLTGRDPTNAASPDAWALDLLWTNDAPALAYERIANIGFDVQWSTNLVPTPGWESLDDPQNAPFFSHTNYDERVSLETTNSNIYYRMQLYRP